MKNLSLVIVALISVSGVSEGRQLRPLNRPSGAIQRTEPQGFDQRDTLLRYESDRYLEYYLPLPGAEPGDNYYNVRFSPPFWPFRIVEAQVPLFGGLLEGRPWDYGQPGMRVVVWQSGEVDGVSGLPAEVLDSVDVPYDSLRFGNDTLLIPNRVRLDSLQISFGGPIDFHIGVVCLTNGDDDSLGIYLDDGRHGNQEGRSVMWTQADGWQKVVDLYDQSHNFAIRAVIEDLQGVRHTLEPARAPEAYFLSPASPNPFNRSTALAAFVPPGRRYALQVFDCRGVKVAEWEGRGQGMVRHSFDFSGIPSGTYYISLSGTVPPKSVTVTHLK